MSSYRPFDRGPPQPYRRHPYDRNERDGRFYDDRRSRSRSRDREQRSPPERRGSHHELSRTPPRGPAADTRSRDDRGWNNGRGKDYDRDDYRGRASSSSRRGRYRDWDREDYSPPYSRSRSRSPARGRHLDYDVPPSREIMMEGLRPEMTEDDVSFIEPAENFQADIIEPALPPQKVANVGDSDASPDDIPSQFLLLRGLEPSVSEELLAKGVSKLFKPTGTSHSQNQSNSKKGAKVASTTGDANLGAKEGTLRRIFLVRDRKTNESWRFGFAEYATIEDAQAALTRYNSFEKFTIASKAVLASYIHAGVFVPVVNPTASIERFTFSPLTNPSLKLSYWDEGAYVTELKISDPEPEPAAKPPTSAEPDTKLKDAERTKKRKVDTTVPKDISASKKIAPSHLQFWSNRHAELHGISQNSTINKSENDHINPNSASSSPSRPQAQSFADTERLCCYLCYRQFKTVTEVNKHERLSQLHRDNLKNTSLVERATTKLQKHHIQVDSNEDRPEYRDRARERRQAFGVQKKNKAAASTKSKPFDEAGAAGGPTQTKGASLLSKMGFDTASGKGLGAQGTSMTAPIAQDVYAAGVGLGAQGGKLGDAVQEAERNTKGDYGEFLEQTKQRARERYEKLG
ncbi:MAG: hypothetical protein Q9227_006518 [Pyrenula ochraceoflavens]